MDTRKSAKPSKKTADGGKPSDKPRQRTDWQAVERDYRTGKFTLRELGAKYSVSHGAVAKQVKTKGWTQDLAKQIKQATNARLVAELVDKEVNKGITEVSNTVLVAAEVNKNVILGHREDLKSTRQVASNLLAELTTAGLLLEHRELFAQILAGEGAASFDVAQAQQAINRALSLGNRVKSLKALADAFTSIQAAERVAFGLDEKAEEGEKAALPEALADFVNSLHGAATGRIGFAPPRKA